MENSPSYVAFFASNVAFDPQRRMSAHAIFSRVKADKLPWRFPGPCYVVYMINGVEPGERTFALSDTPGLISIPGKLTVDESRSVISFITVTSWEVQKYGEIEVYLTLDGQRTPCSARVNVEPVAATLKTEQNDASRSAG